MGFWPILRIFLYKFASCINGFDMGGLDSNDMVVNLYGFAIIINKERAANE